MTAGYPTQDGRIDLDDFGKEECNICGEHAICLYIAGEDESVTVCVSCLERAAKLGKVFEEEGRR